MDSNLLMRSDLGRRRVKLLYYGNGLQYFGRLQKTNFL